VQTLTFLNIGIYQSSYQKLVTFLTKVSIMVVLPRYLADKQLYEGNYKICLEGGEAGRPEGGARGGYRMFKII
jgi:hypothetical protein